MRNLNNVKKIRMLIMDVDGVLTDGKIMMDDLGREYKTFHVKDGEGIKQARRDGIIVVFFSGRTSKTVAKRAEELGVKEVYQGIKDKVKVYEKLKEKYGLRDEQIAYIGDDLNDLQVFERAGFPIAVGDSIRELKERAVFVTKNNGGNGAVREAIEHILKMSKRLKTVAIIPARYGSTRLKGKPLVTIAGKPMIQHVYEQVKKAELVDEVVIATDSKEIYDVAFKFGAKVKMTSNKHETGTDRIGEVTKEIHDYDIVLNIQGDEPMVRPEMVNQLVFPFLNDPTVVMTTLVSRIKKIEDYQNPNIVKAVLDKNGNALYFSRSPIPYISKGKIKEKKIYKHIGMYGYRKDFLLKFIKMERSTLEKYESLEQLRVLENGYNIKAIETKYDTISVDTPEDLIKVRAVMEAGSG
jgi:3-deoxy-manno-octulosonate cytidylyltransferase (CMP-KDO synthetase)